MRLETIEFNGRFYRLRSLDIGEEFGECFVGSRKLADSLFDQDGNWASDAARSVDETIFYYISQAQFRLSDEKLRRNILSEIQ
jgi:hypothetical protein